MPMPEFNQPSGVSLDRPPALPPNLSGPQASVGGMMGQMSQAAPGSSVHTETIQKAISIEQGLQDLAATLPGFRPIAEQIINVLRQGIVRSLQQATSGGAGAGVGMPSGMMTGSQLPPS